MLIKHEKDYKPAKLSHMCNLFVSIFILTATFSPIINYIYSLEYVIID